MANAKEVLKKERAALCDTLERVGPDQPTLCDGWTTTDLAAHLVVRERDPRSGPGIMLGGRFGEYTKKLMERNQAKGYEWLIQRLRDGPPAFMVATMPALNVNENFIHHEDVRRANGEAPRAPDAELNEVLTSVMRRMGGFQARRLGGYGLELLLPDGTRLKLRGGPKGKATIVGPIGEAVLYLSGRRDAAQVTLEGDDAALEALRTAKLGI